jgi:transposase InsO family protein
MMNPQDKNENTGASNTSALVEQMAQLMSQMMAMQAAVTSSSRPDNQIITQPVVLTPIEAKFDGTNYSYWCQVVEMHVRGREKMNHLTGEPVPPPITDLSYQKWATDDVVVKGWIINSLEPRLRGSYIRYPTARDVWRAIATTYHDGSDEAQVYALNRQVSRVKQGGRAIEDYFDELQSLWQEIDFRCPNPMEYAGDIEKFNTYLQKMRVYTFLDGLDDTLDGVRAQVVLLSPFPTIEQAYGYIRREATRQGIMIKGIESHSAAMISKGYRFGKGYDSQSKKFSHSDKNKLKCTNCGKGRHTKDQCFELVGYPEWWKGDKKNKYENKGAAANYATAGDVGSKYQPELKHHDIVNAQQEVIARNIPTVRTAEANYAKGTEGEHHEGEGNNGNFNTNLAKCNITSKTENSGDWVIDSGATDHMTHNETELKTRYTSQKGGIINANGKIYPVKIAGDVVLSNKLCLKNTLVVPSLATNLISVSQLTRDQNCTVLMFPDYCVFQDILTKRIIGHGTRRDGLYYLDELKIGSNYIAKGDEVSTKDKIWLWHRRLGHPSFGYMKKLLPNMFINLNPKDFSCETCVKSKSHRVTYYSRQNKCVIPCDLIHTDVWGPSPITSKSGCRWYISFIDDCSRMVWLYLLKSKDEVPKVVKDFHKMVKTQFGKEIKIMRSDNGTEYLNKCLQAFFNENGIIHETTCVGTPQQNGIAERKNRHLLEMTRALLFENKVPHIFWDNALSFAVYLSNRTPTSANEFRTPIQVLSDQINIPSILNLPPKIFGCVAYVHIQKPLRTKLEPRAEKCVFLGMGTNQKGYKCYNPETRKFYTTMDVNFLENEKYFENSYPSQGEREIYLDPEFLQMNQLYTQLNPCISSPTVDSIPTTNSISIEARESSSTPTQADQHGADATGVEFWTNNEEEIGLNALRSHLSENNEEVCNFDIQPKLPPRINRGRPPKRYVPEDGTTEQSAYPIANYTSTKTLCQPLKNFTEQLSSNVIPERLEDALKSEKWTKAMSVEMEALEKNNTWKIIELPPGKKPVGCKWVYSIKYNAEGKIERYKARLVAKGYTQTYGVDFQETFSPVAKLNSVRVLLSLAANFDWPLHQFDVKNAFLHGELEEEIYMELPPGYEYGVAANKVCKLEKALYGLKQSPRAWFGRFCRSMKNYGYNQGDSDHTMFFKRDEGRIAILIIYVDDMIITGDDKAEIQRLELKLSKEFDMKNLGGLKYFLGIEVSRTQTGIFLSQRKYVLDLLAETGMLNCKPVSTPMEQNLKLEISPEQCPTNKERYQKLVGKLIYLSHTRPDIAYAVGVVSQFMHNPSEDHMGAVIRILRYLKGTPGKGIKFEKSEKLEIEGYTDADWAGNIVDRKSTSGYFTFVGGNLVTWRSKKQNVVALSSAEAEFRGMVKGICELLWLRKLLAELGMNTEAEMKLYCDNKAAIDISHNPVQHDRTKHIEVDRHFIKEKLDSHIISLPFVRSVEQVADILTKAVANKQFEESLKKIGMTDIYVPREGEC